ncbi:uncharacterized protein LTR77_010582 [Saxophila tyrrhenica]|uniref:N-acetyltransferase domain-containing protein n=1 Tax=Saxophila tyrrhenica TaxID=1690608 RepID=A0AAV9NVA2_9PEZI|nr:hypothetical protein LTR77_010582 [Saxophila tyrrhenica]
MVKVTSGGKDYHPQAAALTAEAFKNDPTIRYILGTMTDKTRKAYLPAYFNTLFRAAMLNGAVFQEANDWSSCAVWMLPGRKVDNPWTMVPAGLLGMVWKMGFTPAKRMLWEYAQQSDKCKHEGLRDRDGRVIKEYHYLFFIATPTEHRGKGLASEIIAQYQERNVQDGRCIYLEATTPKSRDMYARQGFKTVGMLRLGKGTHDENANVVEGGPGVPLWAMIWRPGDKKSDGGDSH